MVADFLEDSPIERAHIGLTLTAAPFPLHLFSELHIIADNYAANTVYRKKAMMEKSTQYFRTGRRGRRLRASLRNRAAEVRSGADL